MMPQMDLKEYCDGCPEFSPEVEKLWADDHVLEMYVRCAYQEQCDRIAKFLENKTARAPGRGRA